MKRTLYALALLASASPLALAQGNVTIYGTFDGGVRNLTNSNAAGDSKLSAGSNGTYLANRFGFTGTEDLGGDNKIKFMLESGFNTGTGALDNANGVLFNRAAWISVAGKWGSLMAGRQYTVAFAAARDYEPFTFRYISLIPVGGGAGTTLPAAAVAAGLGASATSGTRFNNDLQYRLTTGPVTVMAEYAAGEQAGSVRNGAAQAVGLKYAEGALNLGGAYTQKKTIAGQDNISWTVGGGYQIGELIAKVGYAKERQETRAAGTYANQLGWVGLLYQITPKVELAAAWYQTRYRHTATGERDFFILSYHYALSKRSRLYVDLDRNLYRGALVPATRQTSQTGITVGLSHSL